MHYPSLGESPNPTEPHAVAYGAKCALKRIVHSIMKGAYNE